MRCRYPGVSTFVPILYIATAAAIATFTAFGVADISVTLSQKFASAPPAAPNSDSYAAAGLVVWP